MFIRKLNPSIVAVTLFTLQVLCLRNHIHAQSWVWASTGATSGGTVGAAEGYGLCTDVSGNVISTGYFQAPSIVLGTFTLSSSGATSYFVVKRNSNGNVLWAKTVTGSGNHYGNSVCADAAGNIIVTGVYQGTAVAFGTFTLSNPSGNNAFVVKYDASGNELWARLSTCTGFCNGQDITTDTNGNIFVTGWYNQPAAFGSASVAVTGTVNAYVLKLDAGGNPLWIRNSSGGNLSCAYGVCCDPTGNPAICGFFNSASTSFSNVTLPNSGTDDIFVVKYDANGNLLWGKKAGGTKEERALSAAADASGNIHITGYFKSTALPFGTNTINCPGTSADIFLAKYSPNGTELWANAANGPGLDQGYDVAVNTSGVFISGSLGSLTNTVGGSYVAFGTTTVSPPPGSYDPSFIAEYTPAGGLVNVIPLTSAGDDVLSIAVDDSCAIFASGDFYKINPFVLGTHSLALSGFESEFAAKFKTVPSLSLTGNQPVCAGNSLSLQVTGATSYSWNSTPTGTLIVIAPGSNGSYTLTGKLGSCPVTASLVIPVTVKPAPSVTITSSRPSICAGEKVTLTGSGLTTYSWSTGSTVPTTTVIPNATSSYTVSGIGANNCPGYTVTAIQVVVCQNIAEAKSDNDILLFPNPNHGEFNLTITRNVLDAEIRLIDEMGRLIHSQKIQTGSNRIKIEKLAPGVYYYSIRDGSSFLSKGKVTVN